LRVLGLPSLFHSVMAIEGALNCLTFSSCVNWENLLKAASLLNCNGGHNKAIGWGIGLPVAAQGNLTEPVKDNGFLLFLDFPKLFGSLGTTLRIKDKNK